MASGDERLESVMGTLLRTGVLAAAAVVLAGGIWFFAVNGNAALDFHVFQGEPAGLRGPGGVLRGAFGGDARSVIQLGLLMLIATPIARVVFAVAVFAMQKDRTYVAIGLVVLGALLYGLTGW